MIGYQVCVTGRMIWRDNQGGLFPLSPPLMLSGLSVQEAFKIMKEQRALFLRWESEFDQCGDFPWWHVIKDTPDTLESLPKKTRYMIRKAAKDYEARPVDTHVILKHGYGVYVSAYQRYETHEPMFNRDEFCEAINKLPQQTEWWGVFEQESQRLVAFSENYIDSNTCFYVTMWLEPEAMAKFAGYLLFYEMERHYLEEREFKYVSDGSRSLSHDTNIHDFLISKFNFRKAFARLHVVYTPWLGAAVTAAYPLRKLIAKVPLGPFKKASILLKQEMIRRQCSEGAN